MKYRVFINDKPIQECSMEERYQMDLAIVRSFKEVFDLIIPIDENEYKPDGKCYKLYTEQNRNKYWESKG